MKKIQWNKVTWYSKLLAVLLFLAVFALAFSLGRQYEAVKTAEMIQKVVSDTQEHMILLKHPDPSSNSTIVP